MLFQQIRAAALRTGLRHGLVCRSEVAIRIVGAAIEGIAAAARFLLHQFAILALLALHADEILLDVFAVRVSAAGDKFAITSVAQHQVAPTLGANFFQRNVWHALALVKPARGLAIWITRTSHELAKAPALQYHHAAAVFAVFVLAGLRHLRRIKLRQINGILFGKRAALWIIFLIRAARVERAVLAPLEHQRRAAAFALFFRRLLHPLDVFHVLFSVAEVLGKLFVEA